MAEPGLILLRHGIAVPRESGLQDGERALTPEGRERTRRICQRACHLGLVAPALVTSPLVRARETAEIAVAAGLAPDLACRADLAPGADPWPFLQEWFAATGPQPQRLILVGHEPDLGHLACRLLGAPAGALTLKKAGIAVLGWTGLPSADFPPGPVRLELLLSPRVLIGS